MSSDIFMGESWLLLADFLEEWKRAPLVAMIGGAQIFYKKELLN